MRKQRSRHGAIQPVVLILLDGFGLRTETTGNAIALAKPPHLEHYFQTCPHLALDPSGAAVGLPRNQAGNSAVGHFTIGAGRIIEQDLIRINKAIKDRTFFTNPVLKEAMKNAAQPGRALHLLGLCSDAGVHSHLNHLYALLEMAKRNHVSHVFIHAIADGRDVPQKSARKYLAAIEAKTKSFGIGELATITGRRYAMDRAENWELGHDVYDTLVHGKGPAFGSWSEALTANKKRNDSHIPPCILTTRDHRTPRIIDGDSVIFFNFRSDRARQLTHGFTDLHFRDFRQQRLALRFVTFTKYDDSLELPVAFPRPKVKNTLSEVLSKAHINHFHCAEQEKFSHVTTSFSGGAPQQRYERHACVPSKERLTPGMNAAEITRQTIAALRSHLYGALIINYANLDIIGHTGDLEQAKKAVTYLDHQVSHLIAEARLRGYTVIITADHGNAEDMTPEFSNFHTDNNVPFILIEPHPLHDLHEPDHPALCDIAPTLLRIMGLPVPKEMEGRSLVKRKK